MKQPKRISFNDYSIGHLYELALQNFQKDCVECESIKKRIEKFLGKKEVKRIKRLIKKNPY